MLSELPKRWILKEADEQIVERQSQQAKISPLLARLLVLRGLADLTSLKCYLSSSLRSDLPSPFTMARDPLAIIPSAFSLVVGALDRAFGFWKLPEDVRKRWFDRMPGTS